MNAENIAYISLGSNLGQPERNLELALERLNRLPKTRLDAVSRVYRTEPQGDPNQPWFCNQAARLRVGLEPLPLLRALQEIEAGLGRNRSQERRFGPRSLDLDILLYVDSTGRNLVLDAPELTLPHPRLAVRAFALVPLLEIEPELRLPDGRPLRKILDGLEHVLDDDKIFQNK